MDEVEYSNVTKTESGRGCGLGRGVIPEVPGEDANTSPAGTRGILQSKNSTNYESPGIGGDSACPPGPPLRFVMVL